MICSSPSMHRNSPASSCIGAKRTPGIGARTIASLSLRKDSHSTVESFWTAGGNLDIFAMVRSSATLIRTSKTARTRASFAPDRQQRPIIISHYRRGVKREKKKTIRSSQLWPKFTNFQRSKSGGLPGLHVQSFIGFRDNLIDHGFNVVGAFPEGQLSIGASAFTHDFLDVRDLRLATEFIHFCGNELKHLVKQFPLVHFTFAAEVDQFAVQAVAGSAPPIFINQATRITAKGHVLAAQLV